MVKGHPAFPGQTAKELKAAFEALASVDALRMEAASHAAADQTRWEGEQKKYVHSILLWREAALSELASRFDQASSSEELRVLVGYVEATKLLAPLNAAVSTAKDTALERLAAEENGEADVHEAKRLRGLGDAELQKYCGDVREMRRQLAALERTSAERVAQVAADEASSVARAPILAEALRKTIRQALKAQFTFNAGLPRGRTGNMKSESPGVTQAVWDLLFPAARGVRFFQIDDPSRVFGVAYSYFCREMRYGSNMEVHTMQASLAPSGQLTVKGKYGMGSM